jgi:CIC family chloride channel protein
MAAVFAGATRAPFSAILIIFEMTGDYAIILPLMGSVVVSTVLNRAIRHETIYTLKLLRRGVDIEREEMVDVLRTVTVKETMTKDFPIVPVTMKIDGLARLFHKTGHHGFPVVDKNGLLVGVVNQTDLERQLGTASKDKKLTAGDIADVHPLIAYPDQYLNKLLDSIDDAEARIPVVSREDNRRLLGVVGRHEIISIYRKKSRKRVSGTVQR